MTDLSLRQALVNAQMAGLLQRHFASTDEDRYYLQGVAIFRREAGVVLVATDGARMGMFLDPHGWCTHDGMIVRVPWKAACARAKGDGLLERYVAVADQRAMVVLGPAEPDRKDRAEIVQRACRGAHLGALEGAVIDGMYPDWQRVITCTCEAKGDPAGFRADVLEAFTAVAKASLADGRGGPRAVVISPMSAAGPAMVRIEGLPGFVGVAMPVRHGFSDHELPGWVRPPGSASCKALCRAA
jgi:hypothetical protein